MSEKHTETKTTEKPADIVTPGKEVTTETTTTESASKVVPQVAEKQEDGSVVNQDAPTEDGTRFR